MKIKCKYWEDCDILNGGCCTVGEYDRPSFGVCLTVCTRNTSEERQEEIGLLEKAKQYIKAEASLALEGEVDEGVYNHRIETCKSCEHLKQTSDAVGHCKRCGCGYHKRAGLTVKGKMPKATCPLNKWKA